MKLIVQSFAGYQTFNGVKMRLLAHYERIRRFEDLQFLEERGQFFVNSASLLALLFRALCRRHDVSHALKLPEVLEGLEAQIERRDISKRSKQ